MPPNIGYAGDPILRQIRAMAQSNWRQAQAEGLKERQRLLIDAFGRPLGSPPAGASLGGLGGLPQ